MRLTSIASTYAELHSTPQYSALSTIHSRSPQTVFLLSEPPRSALLLIPTALSSIGNYAAALFSALLIFFPLLPFRVVASGYSSLEMIFSIFLVLYAALFISAEFFSSRPSASSVDPHISVSNRTSHRLPFIPSLSFRVCRKSSTRTQSSTAA